MCKPSPILVWACVNHVCFIGESCVLTQGHTRMTQGLDKVGTRSAMHFTAIEGYKKFQLPHVFGYPTINFLKADQLYQQKRHWPTVFLFFITARKAYHKCTGR